MDNNLYCLQNVCRFFICDLFGVGFMTDVFDFVFFSNILCDLVLRNRCGLLTLGSLLAHRIRTVKEVCRS